MKINTIDTISQISSKRLYNVSQVITDTMVILIM